MAPSAPKNANTLPSSPTKKESPFVGQLPPLMNFWKTSDAGTWGPRMTSGNRMAKKPRT